MFIFAKNTIYAKTTYIKLFMHLKCAPLSLLCHLKCYECDLVKYT